MGTIATRKASHQGSKHIQNGYNNQDGRLLESFSIPSLGKSFHIGIVSDGCTGIPAVSRTEVGAQLLPPYAYGRIQELICSGAKLDQIPLALFQMITEFIRRLSHEVMPPNIHWPYPKQIENREGWDANKRFRADYLSATLLGFITDETNLVIFSAGDGIILVNDDLTIIDQNDRPDYPASSINRPGGGFETKTYSMADVQRLAIMTDGFSNGLKSLVHDKSFRDSMFSHLRENPLGLQFLLNTTYRQKPECMQDDCTAVTLEQL